MKIEEFGISQGTEDLNQLAKEAFNTGTDSNISEWFSFLEMIEEIKNGRGTCLKVVSDNDELAGFVYAHQESRINGREGLQKWVVIIMAVKPSFQRQGVGALMLGAAEEKAKSRGALKMFVYTNTDDDKVINFYKKNGYVDAGQIKDYQYGKDNSAIFLLKYLK